MSNTWTKEQENAFTSLNGTVLVSAAAGSGKTAVLVERVIKRLTDSKNPTKVERILVVTFTKAAAQEMRERIDSELSKCIENNPENASFLKRQKTFLPSANISTMDSFCNTLVKDNFQKLNITPDFSILDEKENELLMRETVLEVLEEIYNDVTGEHTALLRLFTNGKNDENLVKSIIDIYNFAFSSANPKEWIDEHFDCFSSEVPVETTKWGSYTLNRVKAVLELIASKGDKILLDAGDDNKVGVTAKESIGEVIDVAKKTVDSFSNLTWNEIKKICESLSVGSFGRFKADEKDKLYYEIYGRCQGIKKDITDLCEIITCDSDEFKEDIKYLEPIMKSYKKCVFDFIDKLNTKKREQNAYYFLDITHMALSLLVEEKNSSEIVKTELAKELSTQFDEILIDEFQDTNDAQDTLFRSISQNENNIFMVGDVKQSIYRFRHAMPQIFIDYRDRFNEYNGDNYPAKISLDKNFRSREGIVDGVNFFFDYLMTRKMGDVDYKNGDRLNFGATNYSKTDNQDVHFHIFNTQKSSGDTFSEEMQYVGKLIKDIIASKMTVTVKEKGEFIERQVSYKDICLLIKNFNKRSPQVVKTFAQMGIPVYCEKDGGFFSNAEILTMISLLKVIDNPVQDVPLMAVMLSPMFPFTEDDLAEMRCAKRNGSVYSMLMSRSETDEKVKSFLVTISRLRSLSVTLGIGELIRRVFEITSYDSVVGAMANGEKRVLNLERLITFAEKYEANGGRGLTSFLRYVEKLRKNKYDIDGASAISENDDVVRAMTIHKSKGLEFPVVIVADITKSFEHKPIGGPPKIIADLDMGIGTRRYDENKKLEYNTQVYDTVNLKRHLEELSEEMRVYYVAMTRAREKLYLVGTLYDANKKIQNIYHRFYTGGEENAVSLSLCDNFLEWAVLAMLYHPSMQKTVNEMGILNCKPIATNMNIEFKIVDSVDDVETEQPDDIDNKTPQVDAEMLVAIKEKIGKDYAYAEMTNMPIKYSASHMDESKGLAYLATEKPAFMGKGKFTPAQRGTLSHKFMEACDMENASNNAETELSRLQNEGVFTEEEANAIDLSKIKEFFQSSMYQRIISCEKFLREQQFTMCLPAGELIENISDVAKKEEIVVQGIVDGLIINGSKGEIIDYKTDRINSLSELEERYSKQMQVYKKAAEECFGLKEVSVTLYSFALSEEISLKL